VIVVPPPALLVDRVAGELPRAVRAALVTTLPAVPP
jgi:hypothetical protein